jgi:hypothetical protein
MTPLTLSLSTGVHFAHKAWENRTGWSRQDSRRERLKVAAGRSRLCRGVEPNSETITVCYGRQNINLFLRTTCRKFLSYNGQTKIYNLTLLGAISHYVEDSQTDWDLNEISATHGYNRTVYSSTGFTTFELVFTPSPATIALQHLATHDTIHGTSSRQVGIPPKPFETIISSSRTD